MPVFQDLDFLSSLGFFVKIILGDLAKILLLVLKNTKNQKIVENHTRYTIMLYNLP